MKVLLVLVAISLLIGIVSADTLIIYPNADRIFLNTSTLDFGSKRVGYTDLMVNDDGYTALKLTASTVANNYTSFRRMGLCFNTSSIPDDGTINSIKWSMWISVVDTSDLMVPNLSITGFTPLDKTGSLQLYDGNKFIDTRYATDVPYANLNLTGRNNVSFNSNGLLAINKTSFTCFMARFSQDTDNTPPTWASGKYAGIAVRDSDHAGTDQDSFLEILYVLPDTTPPNSITGLSNTTTCNSINWSFTKPSDADYNGLMVWKNGTFFHNLSSSATSDLWLNLTELTEYTFSSKTFDATNNINATFVNRTSTTSKCPPGPTASFISNVTCGIVPFRVQFNDTTYSSTNLTGWNWSFGEGNYSAVQNPVFEYNISGMFTVNINATNAWGSNISQISNYMRGVPDWATCPVTPTPTPTWQPEINPSTEVDIQPNGWWLIAGGMILFIWFIFRRTR